MKVAKGHGLGNDFLLVAESGRARGRSRPGPSGSATATPAWARTACCSMRLAPDGVRMRLINADGGEAEISGNGLRCLAGYMVWSGARPAAPRRAHGRGAASGGGGDDRARRGTASPPASARPSSTARASPSPSIRPRRASSTIRWPSEGRRCG